MSYPDEKRHKRWAQKVVFARLCGQQELDWSRQAYEREKARRARQRWWTTEQERFLVTHYDERGSQWCAIHLPGDKYRSPDAIRWHVHTMRKDGRWTMDSTRRGAA